MPQVPLDDSSWTTRLLNQAAEQKHHAFARLVSRHSDAVRELVGNRHDPRLNSRVDHSDVVQEVQLEAWKRFDEYLSRRPLPFSIWLRETALQHLGQLRRRHVLAAKRSILRESQFADRSSHALSVLLMGGDSVSQNAVAREAARRVSQALARLEDDQREILVLRHVEQFSNRDISLYLGITENAASKRYRSALVHLQRHMGRER